MEDTFLVTAGGGGVDAGTEAGVVINACIHFL